MKRPGSEIAQRVAQVRALLDAADGFEPLAYGPLPETPAAEQNDAVTKRARLGKRHLAENLASEAIARRQAACELPGDEWREALARTRAAAQRFLAGEGGKAGEIEARLSELADYEARRLASPSWTRERLGTVLAQAVFSGDMESIKTLCATVERWKGERRAGKGASSELKLVALAFDLWRKRRRNPTRAELFTAAERAGLLIERPQDQAASDRQKPLRDLLRTAKLGFIK